MIRRPASLFVAAGFAMALAGCGQGSTETVTVTPGGETVSTTTTTSGSSESATSASSSGSAASGNLGETLEVTGPQNVDLEASAGKLEDPAQTDYAVEDAYPGKDARWVRVTASIENRSDTSYEVGYDTWELIDSMDQRTIGNDFRPLGPEPQLFGTLLPGDRLQGAVVFAVPTGSQPKEVRFTATPETNPLRWLVP